MGEIDEADAAGLARALAGLLTEAHRLISAERGEPLVRRVTDHIGAPLSALPNVALQMPSWEHASLHVGVEAYLAEHSPGAEWFGVAGGHRGEDLIGMLSGAQQHGMYALGAVDYTTVATGPDMVTEVVQLGFVPTRAPGGAPVVLGLRGTARQYGQDGCELRVLGASRESATAVRDEVERLARERDVLRGAVLSFDVSEHRGNEMVSFLPRPELDAADVVLPDGVLDTIERHVVRSAEHSARLAQLGQHLKRGLLLHGPPGTGKTHTVRYLLGRLHGYTVVVLSGRAMGRLAQATTLVRRLQPSVLVIEDVDLVAEDRAMHRSSPLLFELLNRIDGIDADADVTFILTTNRVADMERALADRPGRVDLAVEVPPPDAAGREQLLRLYARDMPLDPDQVARVVAATEGVTASYVRELVRRAVLRAIDADPAGQVTLQGAALDKALAELTDERSALTSALLGGTPPVAAGRHAPV